MKQLHKQHINVRKKGLMGMKTLKIFIKIYIFEGNKTYFSIWRLECIFPEQARQIFPPLHLTRYSINKEND